MPPRYPNNDDKKIVPFDWGASGNTLPEDEPGDWVFPQDSSDDFMLRALANAIVEQDPALTELLVGTATGDVPTGELVRQLDAWQASMRPPRVPGTKPWLV
jgi:hypothetical protein